MTFFQLIPSTLVAALWSVGTVYLVKLQQDKREFGPIVYCTNRPQRSHKCRRHQLEKSHFFSPCSKVNLLEDGQGVTDITGLLHYPGPSS